MSTPKIALVAAMAHDRVIGKNNQMPWHMPADLRHFKAVTLGKPVIMGRKTHESIGMVLPGRLNIVISRNADYVAEGCTLVTSIEQALEAAGAVDEVMIIGGANIYSQVLAKADTLHLTLIDLQVDGDARFPDWTEFNWRETERQRHQADDKNPHDYQFVTLERVR